MKKLVPLGILGIVIALVYAFDLHSYLTFEALQENRLLLQNFVKENFFVSIILFFFIYVIAVALSLPGGAVMSITGGFLFGTILGTSLVVGAATLGATLLFLIAKTALGEMLQQKAGPWLEKMRKGFQNNAFFYLLTLRLVPLFPFFIVNLVPAFLGVKIRDYILATFIGIIPGSFVFVSVGTGIGSIFDRGETFSAHSILTPEILIALVGLGILSLLPVVFKYFKKH
ncbi:MAG TPA: hypothetical protein DD412_07310 [Holosporales bacterium]|nr:hypothetical protein [Holosporales bacterium]